MARRRLLAGLLITGSVLATLLYRRRTARRVARVDLYYEDGSMISLEEGAPGAERLLAHARSVLGAATR